MSSDPAVLVVGDVMLDERVEGEMRRISPEAPVPVIRRLTTHHYMGGAANTAACLAALGRRTYLLGVVGDDDAGQRLQQLCGGCDNLYTRLLINAAYQTIVKSRVICHGQQVVRLDTERPHWNNTMSGSLTRSVEELCHTVPIGLVVISDYGKGVMTGELVDYLRTLGVPLFVDCKPANAPLYRGVALLKPNLDEALQICADVLHPALTPIGAEAERPAVLAREVHRICRVNVAMVTHGAGGCTWFDGQEVYTSSAQAQEVLDVTGAGDVFLATLADSALRGYPLSTAAIRANIAAGVSVRHHGTYHVSAQELVLEERRQRGYEGKIYSMAELQELLAWWRAGGKRVVLTNGCFRYLHQGHWSSLQWAAGQGDVLVVGVNSDQSLQALRGDVVAMPETYRAKLVACLPFVDAVVLFDEPSVESLVKTVLPDVLVKGAEYRDQGIPGAEHVIRRGGDVRFSPMLEGIRVTDLLKSPS